MKHREIVAALEELLKYHDTFKKFESSLPGAAAQKAKMPFVLYYQQIKRINKENRGTLENNIQKVTALMDTAKPDFLPISNGFTVHQLEQFSKVTNGSSQRMEDQLLLTQLLEVKSLFKEEMDIFKPQNITRLQKILKEIK